MKKKFHVKVNIMHILCIIIILSVGITAVLCMQDAKRSFGDGAASANEQRHTAKTAVMETGARPVLTGAEVSLACQLISLECEGEPFSCRVAAAAVLLNRLESADYPNEFVNVVFAEPYFLSVAQGRIGEECAACDITLSMEALDMALQGVDPTGGALRFAPQGSVYADSIASTYQSGGMVFGK